MLRSFYFYFFTFFNEKLLVPQVPQVPEVPRSADPQFSNTRNWKRSITAVDPYQAICTNDS